MIAALPARNFPLAFYPLPGQIRLQECKRVLMFTLAKITWKITLLAQIKVDVFKNKIIKWPVHKLLSPGRSAAQDLTESNKPKRPPSHLGPAHS